MNKGPRYFVTASIGWDDHYVFRALLNGLNSYGREWQEEITILSDQEAIVEETSDFKYLKGQEIDRSELFEQERVNIVMAFVQSRLSGRIQDVIDESIERGIPAYAILRCKK